MATGFESRSLKAGRILRIVIFLLAVLFIFTWAWKAFHLLQVPHPAEYRDLATIQLTQLFSRHVNPYSSANNPPFFYLYGFLFSLVVSPLARLAGSELVLLHKIVTLLCVLCASFLASLEVRRNTRSLLLQTFCFALMLMTGWNNAPFIVRPDSFGLLLTLLIPFILRRNDSYPAIALCAVLTIAAFYTKQYFLFIAAPVFVYVLLKDWRKAAFFIAASSVLAAGSVFLVRAVFPGFFYASLVAQANSVGGPIRHLLLQSLAFARRTWPLFLLMCYPLVKRGEESGLRIYYLVFATAAACLFFIGTNTGAWLSYYYQLALPSMSIIGLSMLARVQRGLYQAIFLLLIAAASLFNVPKNFQFFPAPRKENKATWERAYALLDRHKSPQMLLSPVFADYTCRNSLEPVDNGNTEYYENLRISKNTLTMRILGVLLPDIAAQFGRYAAWRAMLSRNVQEQEYTIIAVTKNYHPLVDQDDLEKFYRRIDEANLQLAGEKSWPIEFWIPNPDR